MKRKVGQYLKNKYGPDRAKEHPEDGHYEYAPEDVGPLLLFLRDKASKKLHSEKPDNTFISTCNSDMMRSVLDEGQAGLHKACQQSNLQDVEMLLATGADVNAEDDVSICFIDHRYSIVMVRYMYYCL